MSIKVTCQCGKVYTVADSAAGKTGTCKECGNKFKIIGSPINHTAEKPNTLSPNQTEKPINHGAANHTADAGAAVPENQSAAQSEFISCPFCGEQIKSIAKKCKHCMEYLDPVLIKTQNSSTKPSSSNSEDSEEIIKQIYDRENLSSMFWIVFGILQCLTGYLAFAGAWNIVNGILSRKHLPKIKQRDASIPEVFDKSLTGIVIIGAVNIFFGGLIGVAFAVYDYYVRKLVLENKGVFDNAVSTEEKEIASVDENKILEKIHSKQKTSSFLWFAFGIILIVGVCAGVGFRNEFEALYITTPFVVIGMLHILYGIHGYAKLPKILKGDKTIPNTYAKNIPILIFFGICCGLPIAIYEFFTRKLVLEYKHIFIN